MYIFQTAARARFGAVFALAAILSAPGIPAQAGSLAPLETGAGQVAAQNFVQGQFRRAAVEALSGQKQNPKALAFASRALLAFVKVSEPSPERDAALARAERYARKAIDIEPATVEAHINLAIVLGYRGRQMHPMKAHMSGMAEEAREHIDAALRLEPDNPYALAVDGSWHLEIIARGGSFMGGLLYGADEEHGLASYEKARTIAPDSLLFDFQYAVCLLSLDRKENRPEAMTLLRGVETKTAEGALEGYHREAARHLLATLEAEDEAALEVALAGIRGLEVSDDGEEEHGSIR